MDVISKEVMERKEEYGSFLMLASIDNNDDRNGSLMKGIMGRSSKATKQRQARFKNCRLLVQLLIIEYLLEFIIAKRGLKLYTCCWAPVNKSPKALIFLCHGYAVDCSFQMQKTGVKLSEAGYAVHGMDYEGHGKSAGLQGYIPNLDAVITDCYEHYINICEKKENKNKKRFLHGESMGGVVALIMHRKNPTYWDGAVLVAPMCKIADELRPNAVVHSILGKICKVVPTWKMVPTQDLIETAIRNPEWKEQVRNSPLCYKGKPCLQTVHELFRISMEMEKNLYQVSLPFLIVHGGEDTITVPGVSRSLYIIAASKDKTFKLYLECGMP